MAAEREVLRLRRGFERTDEEDEQTPSGKPMEWEPVAS